MGAPAVETSASPARREGSGLHKSLGATQYFTMGFGCIIGSSWVVVLGEWLNQAGPAGAMLGFLIGGLVMMLVGLCYAEVATMLPVSGGELAYAYEIFGMRTSFVVGWFLALVYVSVVAFEAIAAAWVVGALVPGVLGPTLYTVGGSAVQVGGLLIGLGGTLLITYFNYRGVESAARFQDFLTYGLIALALVFLTTGLIGGSAANLEPLFRRTTTGGIAWAGISSVLITAPFWYGGFNVIPQVMEEKAHGTSLKMVGRVILLALAAAIVFRCMVILSASMAMPWQSLISMELPAAAAFRAAFNSNLLANAVLLCALLALISTWNTVFIGGTRVLFAFGRGRVISSRFGTVHPVFGSPSTAVLFVGIVGSLAIFLGRTAIVPIVNVGATSLAFAYLITCVGLIRLRQTRPTQPRPYRAPGGVLTATLGALGSLWMLALSLYQPYAGAKGRFPLEWTFLLLWIVLGAAFWMLGGALRAKVSEGDRRRLMLGERAEALAAGD